MTERRIDLHTHSLYSDGSMSPYDLFARARDVGVSAVALTDHDTLKGIPDAEKASAITGVELVPGVEISCESVSQIHILGLFVDKNAPCLQEMFAMLQRERSETNKKYLEKLAEYGFPISMDEIMSLAPSGGIGRAHYARVMMNHGWVSSVKEAFDKYLGVGMPCYVKRVAVAPEDAIEVIHSSGGLAVFAHPHQTKLKDDDIYSLAVHLHDCGLDGIEGYYSEYTPEMQKHYCDMAEDIGLLISGGSDFHAEMKPHIELGSGINGNLSIPYSLLEKMKERLGR